MVRHAGPEAAATSPASQRLHGAPARIQQHGRRVAALPAHAEHAVPAAHGYDIEVVAQGPALPVPAADKREVVAAAIARHRLQRIVQPALRLRLVRLAQVDLRAWWYTDPLTLPLDSACAGCCPHGVNVRDCVRHVGCAQAKILRWRPCIQAQDMHAIPAITCMQAADSRQQTSLQVVCQASGVA